ncbi:MAG: hypothetical protein ABSD27_11630, partial [Bryobacteraceae bacterium]
TYWVEVEPLAADTLAFWYTNNLGLPGGMTNINQAGWTALSGSRSLPAFSVTGSSFQVAQTITFAALSNVTIGVAPFPITATASSGLAVSFTSTTTSVCTVSGTTVTIVAVGTCSITASQAGNANYTMATPVTQSFTVIPATSGTSPVIQPGGIVNGASFQPGIARGIWASIFGTNLAPTTRNWRNDEIVNGRFPTSLDGVSVTVDGKPAALCYISPTQINVQVPDDDAIGNVEVALTNAQGTAKNTAVMQTFAPGFFMYGPANGKYIAAQHADYSIIGPPGLYPNATSTPAKPGEVIVLYATGFGPTAPPTPSGQIVTTAAQLVDPSAVAVWIGGIPGHVEFAGITMAGVWQINLRVPDSLPDGDAVVVSEIGGLRSQDNAFITVRQ